MMMSKPRIFPRRLVATGLFLIAAAALALAPALQAQQWLERGAVAPDFTAIGPDGQPVHLSAYRGKIVVLDFWATWCGPCQAAMPHNQEISRDYAKDGVVVLGICTDDTRANYDQWVKAHAAEWTFPTAFDPSVLDWQHSFPTVQYGATGFPTVYVIGRDGQVIDRTTGASKDWVLRRLAIAGVTAIDVTKLPPEEAPTTGVIPAMTKTPALTLPAGASRPPQ